MPTTLFTGGHLFDGLAYRGRLGALLVRDGIIEAVDRRQVRIAVDEVVDLGDGLLLPGFVDAHVHPVQGGLERIRCDLSGLSTREEMLRRIAEYAAANPDLPWILGGGWSLAAFPGGTPLAADLDTVVPDRPVFLANRDHHGAWVNSRALALVATADPADGYFERDEHGVPTGAVHEGAMHAFERIIPAATAAEMRAGLLAGQAYLHAVGVTGWQDAIVGDYSGFSDPGPTYARAAASGELTGDVVGALWWDRTRGPEQIGDLAERRAAYTSERFRATTVKIMQDGIVENFTAALIAPYLDRCGHPTANAGHGFLTRDALRDAVAACDAAGFDVHVHAIGDRGARDALDAFEALGGTRRRHHLAHLQLVDPADVRRFAALGVTANLQQLWACREEQMEELTIPFLGPERAAWQYPFGDLARTGARLAAGSDWPVSSPDPWQAIHVGVNRVEYAATTAPLGPEQALTLEQSLAAYTSGSAWLHGREALTGRIAPGYVADLALSDRNPFAGPAEEIGATRTVGTWIRGRRVHRGL